MTINLTTAIKFEDVHYAPGVQTLADDLELRMVNAGVAQYSPVKTQQSLSLTDAQRSNPLIKAPAGVGNGKIYGENGQEIVISSGGGSSAITYTVVGVGTIVTSATQNAAINFAAAACNGMIIKAGITALEYKRTADSVYHTIRPFETKFIYGITDASEIAVRRVDTASIRATQTTTVRAVLINTTTAIAARNLSVTTTSNSTYTAFGSFACAAVEVTNRSSFDANLRFGGSTNSVSLRRDESLLIPVTANANEISAVSTSNNQAITLHAEAFQVFPTFDRRKFDEPTIIHANAIINLGENSGAYEDSTGVFATIPSFAPFTKFNLKGKLISLFNVAANTVVSGATVADTAIGSNDVFTTRGVQAAFGSVTAPVLTSTANSFSFISNVNTPSGIDVTNSAIHVGLHRLNWAQTVNSVNIDLFSAGTPAAPAADYHRLTVAGNALNVSNADLNDAFAPQDGYGAKSYGINLFSPVGAGATLTAITYARITINASTTGVQVRPSFIKCVKNYAAKGSVIFSIDDNYASAINSMLPLLAPYNFPAVLYPSPFNDKVGNQNNSTGNWQIKQMRMLQDQFGWQIASQDYANSSTVDGGENTQDRSPNEWFQLSSKNLIAAAAYGFDLDGMRDGSHAGGVAYANTTIQIAKAQQLYSSMRMFKNPYTTDASLAGMCRYADTNPPSNPWLMMAVNCGAGAWSTNITAANLAARYQEYAQQAIDCKGIAWLAAHDDWSNTTVQAAMAIFLPWLAGQVAAGNAQVVTPRELRRQQAWAALATN